MSNRRNVFLKASFVLPQWKKRPRECAARPRECVACPRECVMQEGVCVKHTLPSATHTHEGMPHTHEDLQYTLPSFIFWHYGRTKLGHSKKRWATIWHYWSVVYFTESYLHTRISFHSLSPPPPLASLTYCTFFHAPSFSVSWPLSPLLLPSMHPLSLSAGLSLLSCFLPCTLARSPSIFLCQAIQIYDILS
jgi:hypothetical protein